MDETEIPVAIIESEKKPRFAAVWFIPLMALFIGISLVYEDYRHRGPEITIHFKDAAGIEAKRTVIKYRDVVIGRVNQVHFNQGLSEVIVKAELSKDAEQLLSKDTQFWVVRPRITPAGASGIETLLSGAYIAVNPGRSSSYSDEFIGLEHPPKILFEEKGSSYRLRAKQIGSLTIGSPVHYRGIQVGRVTAYELIPEEDYINIDIFIRSPYDQLVYTHSHFWNISGISFNLSDKGIEFKLESLMALVVGGIAFETVDNLKSKQPAAAGHQFYLYDSYEQSQQKKVHYSLPYVLYFQDSVRGLEVGASVEFHGIPIGRVSDISLKKDPNELIKVAVLVALEPERLPLHRNFNALSIEQRKEQFARMMEELVAKGLRARLTTASLLTGQLIIELAFDPSAQPKQISLSADGYPQIPTESSTLTSMTQRIANILTEVEKMPLESIGADLAMSMSSIKQLLQSPAWQNSLNYLQNSLQSSYRNLSLLEQSLPRLLQALTASLEQINALTSERGLLMLNLINMLRSIDAAARSIQSAADYFERHPESLLRGKP